jgi:hypothetical protein
LRELISDENLGQKKDSPKLLATFVMLNLHDLQYSERLDSLIAKISKTHPLYDNITLEKIRLIPDDQLRAKRLEKQYKTFKDRDGGIQALYDLALLRISMWRQQEEGSAEIKKELLLNARKTLDQFIEMYPDNFRTEQAKETLNKIPNVE